MGEVFLHMLKYVYSYVLFKIYLKVHMDNKRQIRHAELSIRLDPRRERSPSLCLVITKYL